MTIVLAILLSIVVLTVYYGWLELRPPRALREQLDDTADWFVTWREVADSLPARIVDAIEATAPCRKYGGRPHIWAHPREAGHVLYGFYECYCGAAVDDSMYRELELR